MRRKFRLSSGSMRHKSSTCSQQSATHLLPRRVHRIRWFRRVPEEIQLRGRNANLHNRNGCEDDTVAAQKQSVTSHGRNRKAPVVPGAIHAVFANAAPVTPITMAARAIACTCVASVVLYETRAHETRRTTCGTSKNKQANATAKNYEPHKHTNPNGALTLSLSHRLLITICQQDLCRHVPSSTAPTHTHECTWPRGGIASNITAETTAPG